MRRAAAAVVGVAGVGVLLVGGDELAGAREAGVEGLEGGADLGLAPGVVGGGRCLAGEGAGGSWGVGRVSEGEERRGGGGEGGRTRRRTSRAGARAVVLQAGVDGGGCLERGGGCAA